MGIDSIHLLRAAPAKGKLGLIQVRSVDDANIIIYCDDDARWVLPTAEQWPDPSAWYDPINDIIFEPTPNRPYPACMTHPDNHDIVGETYMNAVVKGSDDDGAYRPSKIAITLCSRGYGPRQPYLGFQHIRKGANLARPKKEDTGASVTSTIDMFDFLSLTVVHEVSFQALYVYSPEEHYHFQG